jgi:RimJ/RimL family protein N-acetyltransferase
VATRQLNFATRMATQSLVRRVLELIDLLRSSSPVHIRPATSADHDAIWDVLCPMIRAAETYPLPRDMSRHDALAYWLSPDHDVFIAEHADRIVGTYYLRPNQNGGGAHVANCGYVTAPAAEGRGVGRLMCEHSLASAGARRFQAMQFNFVVSANERAVRLWHTCGFDIVGRLPKAFHHPTRGYVDVLVMFRTL